MKHKKFAVSDRIHSFQFAITGLKFLITHEHNARIHLGVGLATILLGSFLQISLTEWLALTLCIGFVITVEIINTAIEKVLDFITLQNKTEIRIAKDLAASGVLVSAITALICGLIIFTPKLIALC